MAQEAEAEMAQHRGESEGAEVKVQQPTEKILGPRKGPSSVLKVSQLLLRAIAAHKGLTLAALKKELGNAGYQVRRKYCRHSGEAPKSDIKGTLIRVSGNSAAGYFRVWKTPKPKRKRKPGHRRLEEGVRSRKRIPAPVRSPWKRRVHGRAAKKPGEVWRWNGRANTTARRSRPRAKDWVHSRAKEETKAKVIHKERGWAMKEDQPNSREKTSSREEKQDPEKPVKRPSQRLTSVKTDSGATHTKTSTKSESPRNAAGNP